MKLLFLFLIPLIITQYTGPNVNKIETYGPVRFQYGNHTINRPLFHFTPTYGWMNDPNGCFYDKTDNVWHLYFQYNPKANVWGQPLYWGHAISKDLNTWKEQPLAIGPPNGQHGVFSGSIFIDSENLSGLFTTDVDSEQRIIAMWTYNYEDTSGHQNQWLSFSLDKGITFITPDTETEYKGKVINPVATAYYPDGGEQKDFRDPQVIKYLSTAKSTADSSDSVEDKRFIMTVTESQQYVIYFYESENGVHFNRKGSYSFGGFLGHQYECPNMCHLKNNEKTEEKYTEEDDSYWVLFVSINPGTFLGGSSTWYVIGQFHRENGVITDDFVFEQTHKYLNIFDYGKDFYAMQLYFMNPTEDQLKDGYDTITGITWASNWQYSGLVPTDPWRSSMTIPREFYLSHFHLNGQVEFLTLKQRPILNHANFSPSIQTLTPTQIDLLKWSSPNRIIDFSEGANGAFEFFLDFQVKSEEKVPHFYMLLRGGSIPDEYLKIGYHDNGPIFYLDRGHTNVQFVKNFGGFNHHIHMFTEHLNYRYNIYGLVDRNIIELFLNIDDPDKKTSYVACTNTFFFTGGNFVSTVEFVPEEEETVNILFYGRQFQSFDYTE